ncbi:MAG: J domain-containing protein [Vicinamibacteria bacterium]|nr:J domain-containing protein [Vicinamibacteria bacterium]
MSEKNYYVILGIARNARPEEIRSAYRALAKRLHPDHAGNDGKELFQDLNEAYETLSDPERRRDHDLALNAEAASWRPIRVSDGGLVADLMSPFHEEARCQPSIDETRARFLRNLTGLGISKGKVVAGLNIEVVLSSEEATRGIVVPLEAPICQVCPFCEGSGREWLFACAYCGGEGVVEHGERIHLCIPPMTLNRSVHEIPLNRVGAHDFYLRVQVIIDD